MKLERFDPAANTGAVRACYEIDLACAPLDEPGLPPMPFRAFAGWITFGWTEDPSESWLGLDQAGHAFGWYRLSLPKRENHHAANVKLQVHPSRRRAGLGTELLNHAVDRARHAGRRLLTSESMEGSAGGDFALAAGAKCGLVVEVNRVLRLAGIPPGRLGSLRRSAESAASGYSLLSWEGPVPADRRAAVAHVYSAMADAPRQADEEPQLWDTERIDRDNVRSAAQGLRQYTVAAQQNATGDLAAVTEVGVHPETPEFGWQEITVVARPHRGHRLGLLIKVAMLEILAKREPQLAQIITGNADSNKHMIAINEALGYEVLNRWLSWELDVAAPQRAGTVSGTVSRRNQADVAARGRAASPWPP